MQTHGVKITWLGHAAFRMQSSGKTFFFDPFLTDNPKCPDAEKHPQKADFILVSHGHSDHVADAVSIARLTGAHIVGMVELVHFLASQGLESSHVVGLNKGGSTVQGGARITLVNAFHSSSGMVDGKTVYTGEAAGFVVHFAEGLRIYFAGDTCIFGDMKLIGELYCPEVAFLPIGDFYTMGPRDAAHAARLLGVRTVVPMHFGTFPILTGTPEELRRELGGACEVVEMTPGQTL